MQHAGAKFIPSRHAKNQRGFSLAMLAVSATVMFGMLGLAVDVGRMFILKNELQTFADASALAACAKLDGSGSGITAADTIAKQGPLGTTVPNGYNFDTVAITNVTTAYATSLNGTYDSAATASAVNPNTYAFMSITSQATMSLYFLPMIPGIPFHYTVSAKAVAGEMKQTGGVTGGGLAPFAPEAHDINDTTNFGFTAGHSYTLKWGNGTETTCSGDLNDPWPTGESTNFPAEHGFVDIGTGNSNANIKDAIVNSDYPPAGMIISSTTPNNTLGAVPGNRGASVFGALQSRSAQDSDQTSLNYTAYKLSNTGNGRRILVVPVSENWGLGAGGTKTDVTVMGFASFFIPPSAGISGNSGPFCAEYIGRATSWNGPAGGTDGTVTYKIVLFR
jgi:Flp pilus assembly protein TadG